MFKGWFILLLLLSCPLQAVEHREAVKGFLDLSQWNGETGIRLNGEWQFFPDQLLEPQAVWQILQQNIPAEHLAPGQRFSGPAAKTKIQKGTYLLRIKMAPAFTHLWMNGMGVYTAAKVFIFQGKPSAGQGALIELGNLGESKAAQQVYTGRSPPIPLEIKAGEDFYLLVQVADYHHYWSGLWMAPVIATKLSDLALPLGFFSCLMAGILLFAFFYNLSLYWGKSHSEASRDLTIISGLMALRSFIQAAYILFADYYASLLESTYELQLDMLYVCLIIGSAYFTSFTQTCFPNKKWRLPEPALYLTSLALILILFLVPWSASEYLVLVTDIFIIIIMLFCGFLVLDAFRKKMDEAWISLLGIGFFIVGGISNFSWALGNADQAQYGIEIGLAIFIYFETQVLARRFIRTLHLMERLTRSLDAKDKVRTQLLQNTSHELRTPLNGILGFLELIQREHYGPINETIKKQLGKTQRLTESLKAQVDEILHLAESNLNALRVDPTSADLVRLEGEVEELSKVSENMALLTEARRNRPKLTRPYRPQAPTYHLLVIDDNAENCEVISEILALDGHQVSIAQGGKAGLEKLESIHPDLILLDLMMPDVSGEDVVRHMKSKENLRDIPIILITARATEEDRLAGLHLGVDDYLCKPLVVDELRLRIRNLLERMELQRILADQEYKDKMSQLGELLADLSHELKNIYQGVDNAELNPTERLQYVAKLLPLPEAQQKLLGIYLPQRTMNADFHQREAWLPPPDRQQPAYRDLRYLRFMVALMPLQKEEAIELWNCIGKLNTDDLVTLSQSLHLLSNHLQLVDVALRSRELIDAILGLNRNEFENQTFSLRTAVDRTMNLLQMRLRKSGIEIICELDNSEAQGSSSAVQQILLNLLNNALDCLNVPTLEDRWIRIETDVQDACPVLKVSNSGPPVTSENRGKLFERGFTTKGNKGSGIGLFVSRRLARRMNGDLELAAASEHTCFVLKLSPPRAKSPIDPT